MDIGSVIDNLSDGAAKSGLAQLANPQAAARTDDPTEKGLAATSDQGDEGGNPVQPPGAPEGSERGRIIDIFV